MIVNRKGVQFDTDTLTFAKSTYSNTTACVEVAQIPGFGVALRDSQNRDGGVQVYTVDEWAAFKAGVAGGEF